MKKRFISLVAAAALAGGMVAYSTAQAGTVTTSGDTNISLYGEVRADFTWSKKMYDNTAVWNNMAKKSSDGGATQAKQNKTNFHSTANLTTVGLELENEDIGVSGCIEAAFDEGDNDILNLKQAYLQHDFENYFVLIGKTDNLLTQEHSSINDSGIAGIKSTPDLIPQVRLGGEFDLGTVTLTPEIAVADVKDEVAGDSSKPEKVSVNRTTMPGVAGKLTASIKTFFGEPINVYGGYSWEQVKLDANGKEKKKSPQVATCGVSVPISWLTLSANYNYMKGATGFSGLDSKPPSYYVKTNGEVEEIKGYGWNIEANLTPIEQASIWGGYSEAKFKDIFSYAF
ncbi:MAG: hypothetical protein B5M53_04605 [Candidatus Cloacimonas sp. 4484_209]|nr:MAG: hypothetical protein B5M53_04605 [Candidatus Cloacimonas sp. 4484_209]